MDSYGFGRDFGKGLMAAAFWLFGGGLLVGAALASVVWFFCR